MQPGLALPLALAVLAGVLGSHLAVPGAIEALAIGLLVVLAGRRVRLAMGLGVAALVAAIARGELDYSTGTTIEVGGGLGLRRL